MPDYTTVYRFLQRLEDDTVERGLGETVRRLRRGRHNGRVSAAVDGTGLAPQASARTSSGASSSTAVGRRAINTI